MTLQSNSSGAPAWLGAFVRHLELLVERNERHQANQEVPCTLFHGTGPAPISPEAYLERIFRYSHCSPVCFIAAGIYMERLAARHPALEPTSLNLHRLLFTGVVIAIKFFDDKYYSNGFYAKVGGVSRSELNLLELEMLQLMDFNAYVGVEDVQSYLAILSAQQPCIVPQAPTPMPQLPACFAPSRPSSGMMSECDGTDSQQSPCDSSNTGFLPGDVESPQSAAGGNVLLGLASGGDACQKAAAQYAAFAGLQQQLQYGGVPLYADYASVLQHPQSGAYQGAYGYGMAVYGDHSGAH